uniref:Uncharacterized protein n=1 Tax=Ditylenchus dipsaci TaxID=166011 RepID=A0A915CQ90_9BILA
MSARDLKEKWKDPQKEDMYNLFWVYPKKDFEKWKQRFHTTKKNWQMKYLRDGFTWYNHTASEKEDLQYSKSADKICEGKMKVAKEADKIGLYRLEFNDDGYEHFISEFNDDTYGNFMSELFENLIIACQTIILRKRNYGKHSICRVS